MYFLSSSYRTRTKAPPIPRSTLDQAPLKKAFDPSSRAIFFQQSMVPVYMMSAVNMTEEKKKSYAYSFEHFMHFWKMMGKKKGLEMKRTTIGWAQQPTNPAKHNSLRDK